MWGELALTLGMGAVSKLTAPKAPSMKPFEGKSMAERMSEIDPTWKTRLTEKSIIASEMMAGNIPKETQDMIEMLSAEKAWQGGFGTSERATRLTARDLGLYQLQIMQAGMKLSDEVTEFTNDMGLSDAEMEWEAYSTGINSALAKYTNEMSGHSSMMEGLMTLGAAAIEYGDFSDLKIPELNFKKAGDFFSGLNPFSDNSIDDSNTMYWMDFD